jgi:hypothetical protein
MSKRQGLQDVRAQLNLLSGENMRQCPCHFSGLHRVCMLVHAVMNIIFILSGAVIERTQVR